jgi:hypothetical protein
VDGEEPGFDTVDLERFGDILTDLGAILQAWLAASNIHRKI